MDELWRLLRDDQIGLDEFALAIDAAHRCRVLDDQAANHWHALALRRAQRFDQAIDRWVAAADRGPVSIDMVIEAGATAREMFDPRPFRRLVERYWQARPVVAKLKESAVCSLLSLSEINAADDLFPVEFIDHARILAKNSPKLMGYIQRWEYRRLHPPARTKMLSLGLNCLPWMVPNRWGLRTGEDIESCHGPFDLGRNRLDVIIRLIAEGFDGYLDPDLIDAKLSPKGEPVPYNRRFKAYWNHNKTAYWTRNRYEKLIGLMNHKIANFERCYEGEHLVFAVSEFPFISPEQAHQVMNQLADAIRSRVGSESRCLIYATTHADLARPFGERTEFAPGLIHYWLPYPSAGYVWADENHANAPEGLDFERAYVDRLKQEMAHAGLE